MSQILSRVRDVDQNDSDAVKEALAAFFQNLTKHKEDDCNRWLRALENIINRFPKYCGQHRIAIEIYLNHFLDSNNYYNVIEAAKCAHAVQQVRPQQEKIASAKHCWREQMSSLCNAAHVLIDALFTKTSAINKGGKKQKKDSHSATTPLHEALLDIDIVSKSQSVTNKDAMLCTKLRNVLVFIQAMLVEIYPVAKPIRPQLILEVILQALSASGNEDSAKVATVKIQALKTLDAMVACLGSNLIPFSALVFRFVMQTLRWSSEHTTEDARKVRCVAYRSVSRWLAVVRECRHSDVELTSHIASDVTPPKHLIQLTPNAQPMKNLSKKARKKLANSMLMQSNISSHGPGEKNKIQLSEKSNDEVAIAALECAETFLTSCGIFLKPTTHKQFQELLVRECYNLDFYDPERGIWLLRALEACRKSCSPKVPPPTQYCLQLYSTLVNSETPEISKISSQALLDIRLHLHCSPPSLNYAIQQQPDTTRDEKRKRVSDRNRAVLENLLGKERMPSEDLAEEMITIADEPSSKRARIDETAAQDILDKISLSSDSGSVEISDDSSVEEVEQLDDSNETDYIIEPIDPQKETHFHDLVNSQEENSQSTGQDIQSNGDKNDEVDGLNDNNDIQELTNQNVDTNDNVRLNSDEIANETDQQEIIEVSNEYDTDMLDKSKENKTETEFNLHDAKTQMPVESSNEIESEKSPPLSMEVAYDYPNTGNDKITVVLERLEEDLPSTNDTDDVQITCGQAVQSSQDGAEKDGEITKEVPKLNGVDKSPEKVVENGDVTEIEVNVASKIVTNDGEVTVEDMLADFVDEVNEDSHVPV